MKISQKLTLSFWVSSLLLLILSGLSLSINSTIKTNTNHLEENSLIEVENSKKMLLSLKSLQVASQELLLKNQSSASASSAHLIREEFSNFTTYLQTSKALGLQALSQEKNSFYSNQRLDRQELALLQAIEREFLLYKQLSNEYSLLLLDKNNYQVAYSFLETQLEPQLIDKLLPLVDRYQENAVVELENQSKFIRKSVGQNNKLLAIFAGSSVLISLSLGSLISSHISKPIQQLIELASQVGKGKLKPIPIDNLRRRDELFILTITFNQMIEGLKNNTVSKFYLDDILDSMIDSLIVIDLEGKIQKVNQATLQLLGYQEQELINKSIQLILPDKSLAFQPNNFNFSYFLGSCETTYLTKEEKIIPVAFSSSYILNDEQEPQGIVCVAKDITEKQLAEKALRESEERYALASRAANDGLWDWNLLSQQIYFSPRWKYLLGYQDSEIGSCVEEWFSRVHPDYLDRLDRAINDHLNNKTSHLEISYPMLHRDGSYRWILCRAITVRDERGKAYRIAGSQTDITQSWLAEEQLRYEAKHDKLTQLPNRTSFHEELEKLIQLTKEDEDYLFAVLFLDLDGFKLINDSLGHQAGDQLLIAIGNKAEACLREGDFIARLGGDEFAILLKQIKDVSDATAIADRIQQELAKPLNLDGHEVLVSASIGIALSQQGYDNFKDFLRDADIAMYQAKARGKARHIVFESDMHLEALKRLQLEQELRRAIEQKQFDVFYQPIIALESGKINGFEVLIRWQHPEKGLVCPAEFIPVAEETGMIASIDWWVLRTACHQIRQWQAQHKIHYPLTISVNISAIQFLISDFTAQILQILEETELEPKYLKLEITESAIIKNLDHASLILEKLKAIGIRISMDDFGTGYSCLSYLYELPIDTLKIDVFFLRDIEKDREKLEVTRTIVNLANNLGMDVIAEGVETSNQLVLLRELNCEYGQGYLFAKPLANQRAEALISSLRY